MIIKKLRHIHNQHRLNTGDVSAHTKSAQKITKEWQMAICSENILSEVRVSPENHEKIDIIDTVKCIAYELKVSGKNPHHEFYKDLVKVLTYNEYHSHKNKIKKLVFITESTGIASLNGRIDSRFKKLIENSHHLTIELVSI